METQKRNTPRDVFLHLFSMVALYWSCIAFITLCWQYANYWFPVDIFTQQASQGSIRFAVASLVIMFPLFLLSSWLLHRIYRHDSQARESRTRRWLIYFTLFIAALIMVIDLVTVMYNLLGGDVTGKFLIKSFSVLLVSAAVFGYYLSDIRKKATPMIAGVCAIVSMVIIGAAVIGAFFIVGSPKQARQAQFDQQRIADLQGIQYQVINYWQKKAMLPNQISDLNDSISGYTVPMTQKPAAVTYTISFYRDAQKGALSCAPRYQSLLRRSADFSPRFYTLFPQDIHRRSSLRVSLALLSSFGGNWRVELFVDLSVKAVVPGGVGPGLVLS